MLPVVREAFFPFTTKHEGAIRGRAGVPWMYLDVLGKVTTGLGYLIDSPSAAATLPWKRPDGSLASREEIFEDWGKVKAHANDKTYTDAGGGSDIQAALTTLRLDDDGINQSTAARLDQFAQDLYQSFPAWDTWPADAQLGLLSMAWAMGPNFAHKFPKFSAAANLLRPDFETMAEESEINTLPRRDEKADGRNADNYTLFRNAEAVLRAGGDPQQLYFPASLADGDRAVRDVTKKVGIGLGGLFIATCVAGAGLYAAKKTGYL